MTEVTPASLRELAARAEALASDVKTAHDALCAAPDEPTQRAGFRLDSAAGWATQAAQDVNETAQDLARIRARSACPADWGACPEHGATLRSSGGQCWCAEPGCGREWGYDRLGSPCTEPVAFEVRAHTSGELSRMCSAHAHAAADRLVGGATLTPSVPDKD